VRGVALDPEADAAAKSDLRPVTEHDFGIKFKEEVLPQKGGGAGTRSLFSHKVVLTRRRRTWRPTWCTQRGYSRLIWSGAWRPTVPRTLDPATYPSPAAAPQRSGI
jgi:hypothetical protein